MFDSSGPVVNNLIYHGTKVNSASRDSPVAEQELFYVFFRMYYDLLEEEIAFRSGISTSQFSRIWRT